MLAQQIARTTAVQASDPARPGDLLQSVPSCPPNGNSSTIEAASPQGAIHPDALQADVLACEPDAPNLDEASYAKVIASPETENLDPFESSLSHEAQGLATIDTALSSMSLSSSPMAQPIVKPRTRQLQLPSFESLGISPTLTNFDGMSPARLMGMTHTPSSSCESNDMSDFSASSSTVTSQVSSLSDGHSPLAARKRKLDDQHQANLLSPRADMLTPPTERELMDWEILDARSHSSNAASDQAGLPGRIDSLLTGNNPSDHATAAHRVAVSSEDATWLNSVVQELRKSCFQRKHASAYL